VKKRGFNMIVSENVGESYNDYALKIEIASRLIHIEGAQNTDSLDCNVESWKTALAPSIRINKCQIITYKDGKTYLYVDLFDEGSTEIPAENVSLYEKSDTISYTVENGRLTVNGKGYAVFTY
jgi:hypothetical protein